MGKEDEGGCVGDRDSEWKALGAAQKALSVGKHMDLTEVKEEEAYRKVVHETRRSGSRSAAHGGAGSGLSRCAEVHYRRRLA